MGIVYFNLIIFFVGITVTHASEYENERYNKDYYSPGYSYFNMDSDKVVNTKIPDNSVKNMIKDSAAKRFALLNDANHSHDIKMVNITDIANKDSAKIYSKSKLSQCAQQTDIDNNRVNKILPYQLIFDSPKSQWQNFDDNSSNAVSKMSPYQLISTTPQSQQSSWANDYIAGDITIFIDSSSASISMKPVSNNSTTQNPSNQSSISDIMENRYVMSGGCFGLTSASYPKTNIWPQIYNDPTMESLIIDEGCLGSTSASAFNVQKENFCWSKPATTVESLRHDIRQKLFNERSLLMNLSRIYQRIYQANKLWIDTFNKIDALDHTAIITDKHALFETLMIFNKAYFGKSLSSSLSDDSYAILKLFRSMNIKSGYTIRIGRLFTLFNQFRFNRLKITAPFKYIAIMNEFKKLNIKTIKPITFHKMLKTHCKFFDDIQNKLNYKNILADTYYDYQDLPSDGSIAKLFNEQTSSLLPARNTELHMVLTVRSGTEH